MANVFLRYGFNVIISFYPLSIFTPKHYTLHLSNKTFRKWKVRLDNAKSFHHKPLNYSHESFYNLSKVLKNAGMRIIIFAIVPNLASCQTVKIKACERIAAIIPAIIPAIHHLSFPLKNRTMAVTNRVTVINQRPPIGFEMSFVNEVILPENRDFIMTKVNGLGDFNWQVIFTSLLRVWRILLSVRTFCRPIFRPKCHWFSFQPSRNWLRWGKYFSFGGETVGHSFGCGFV